MDPAIVMDGRMGMVSVTACVLCTALIYYAIKQDFPAINNAVGITDES